MESLLTTAVSVGGVKVFPVTDNTCGSVESINMNGATVNGVHRVEPNGMLKKESNGRLPPIVTTTRMESNKKANGVVRANDFEGADLMKGPDQILPADTFNTSIPGGAVKLRMEKTGAASAAPISVPTVLKRTAEKYPDTIALRQEKNGKWFTWTYAEYYRDVRTVAKGFIKLGLERFSGVCILGFNSPEWFMADYGSIFAGGLAAGIYTTNSAESCAHCAKNCSVNIFVVENERQLEKVMQIRDELPSLKAIVQYDGKVTTPGVISWDELMQMGKDEDDTELERRLKMMGVNQGCTVIYTSGTTGPPKGAVISHDNLTYTTKQAIDCVELEFNSEQMISYLPLSHIAAQLLDLHIPTYIAATVTFAKPDALKGSLPKTLQEVRPTLFMGVPRVYEKIQEKMMEVGKQTTGLKKMIATWAKASGLHYHTNRMKTGHGPLSPSYFLARTLILKKVKHALGLERMKVMVSGAAPISKDVLEYFLSLDLPIQQVYGMSECTGPCTLERYESMTVGSVGKAIDGLLVKIDEPDAEGNGEICMGGRNVFMGYLLEPAKTKEALDGEGWLRSGDIGKVDEQERVYVTGRIKELIITAGGENIAPVPIEEAVQKELPIISNAMLIGDQKKFLSMILTLKSVLDLDSGESKDQLVPQAIEWCRSIGSQAKTVSDILNGPDEKVMAAIQAGLDRYNKKAVSQAQKIQKWKLLPTDFTQLTGELGPTMKLKRPFVVKKFEDVIESLYA